MANNRNEVNELLKEMQSGIALDKKLGTNIMREMNMSEADKVYQKVVDGINLDARLKASDEKMLNKRLANLKGNNPLEGEFEEYKKVFVKFVENKYAERKLVMTAKQRNSAGLMARERFDEYRKLNAVTTQFNTMLEYAKDDPKQSQQWDNLRKMGENTQLKPQYIKKIVEKCNAMGVDFAKTSSIQEAMVKMLRGDSARAIMNAVKPPVQRNSYTPSQIEARKQIAHLVNANQQSKKKSESLISSIIKTNVVGLSNDKKPQLNALQINQLGLKSIFSSASISQTDKLQSNNILSHQSQSKGHSNNMR